MRPLSMAFVLKNFPLRDWLLFCGRYGSGFLEAVTDAQKNDPAWEEAREALETIANDGAVLHNRSVTLKFLDMPAKNALPFEPLVEHVNRLYAKCYRGVDLATGSRAAEPGQPGHRQGAVGASVQKEEAGVFRARDAAWATGYLNERLDRPIIRFLFDREPRAWMTVTPPLDDTATMDLQSAQILTPMGLRISLAEAYKRFRWKAPEPGEPCLAAPKTSTDAPAEAGKAPEKTAEETRPTKATNDPIGAGALEGAIQSANPNLPDAQVDAADFWSAAAVRKGES
jgi:hypothetical protein